MADIIEMAREIGRQLQKDELYLKLELARQQSEEDEELQNAIGEFNLKRMAINNDAFSAAAIRLSYDFCPNPSISTISS